jgi:hypothetical protein
MTLLGFCEFCGGSIEPDDGCSCGADVHLAHGSCCWLARSNARITWRRELTRHERADLYRTAPHQWGPGRVHHVGPEGDRTLCGVIFTAAPGELLPGHNVGEVDCKRCASVLDTDERREQRNRELDEESERWWARYRAHLESPKWHRKRQQVLWRAGGRCEAQDDKGIRCERWATQIHHLTYERLGDENLDDLVALCRSCHRAQHPWRRWEAA